MHAEEKKESVEVTTTVEKTTGLVLHLSVEDAKCLRAVAGASCAQRVTDYIGTGIGLRDARRIDRVLCGLYRVLEKAGYKTMVGLERSLAPENDEVC